MSAAVIGAAIDDLTNWLALVFNQDVWSKLAQTVEVTLPDGVTTTLDPLNIGSMGTFTTGECSCSGLISVCSGEEFSAGVEVITGISQATIASVTPYLACTPQGTGHLRVDITVDVPQVTASAFMQIIANFAFYCESLGTWRDTFSVDSVSINATVDVEITPFGDGMSIDLSTATVRISSINGFVISSETKLKLDGIATASCTALFPVLGVVCAAAIGVFTAADGWGMVENKLNGLIDKHLQTPSNALSTLLDNITGYIIPGVSLAALCAYLASQKPPNAPDICLIPQDCGTESAWQCNLCGDSDSGSCAVWGAPFGTCSCAAACVPGKCVDTCGVVQPPCCGTDPTTGIDGVCQPSGECCYANCPEGQCGGPDGCGGTCGCPAPDGCLMSKKICTVLPNAYVPNSTFFSTSMSTTVGGPVAAVVYSEQTGLYVNPIGQYGLFLGDAPYAYPPNRAPNVIMAPPMRITYWIFNYMGGPTPYQYTINMVIADPSLAPLGTEPIFMIDPLLFNAKLAVDNVLLVNSGADYKPLACAITPYSIAQAKSPPVVLITAVFSDGNVYRLSTDQVYVMWLPVNAPESKNYFLLGGCLEDSDCKDPLFPFCQADNQCGITSAVESPWIRELLGVPNNTLCDAACASTYAGFGKMPNSQDLPMNNKCVCGATTPHRSKALKVSSTPPSSQKPQQPAHAKSHSRVIQISLLVLVAVFVALFVVFAVLYAVAQRRHGIT